MIVSREDHFAGVVDVICSTAMPKSWCAFEFRLESRRAISVEKRNESLLGWKNAKKNAENREECEESWMWLVCFQSGSDSINLTSDHSAMGLRATACTESHFYKEPGLKKEEEKGYSGISCFPKCFVASSI